MKRLACILLLAAIFYTTATAQPKGWNRALTTGENAAGGSISRDEDGNVYVTGQFTYPSITFGNTSAYSNGGTDVFVVKYNAQGEVQWAHTCGGRGNDEGQAIGTDANGGVYISGTFEGDEMLIDNISLKGSGTSSFFIAKYNADGVIQWARTSASGGRYSRGQCMATDADGNSHIVGTYRGPAFTIGTTELPFVKYFYGMFIARYDSEGNLEWATWADGPGIDQPLALTIDGNNLYMAGTFTSGGISFPGAPVLSNRFSGKYSLFILRYNAATGSLVWSRNSQGQGRATGICTGRAGELYISGHMMADTLRFGNTKLTAAPYTPFVAGYTAQGAPVWAKNFTGSGTENGPALASRNGQLYLAGQYSTNTMVLDTVTLNNKGVTDMFVAALDTTGQVQWAISAGGDSAETLNSIAGADNGEAYVTGSAASPTFRAGNILLNCESPEAFIGKIGEPAISSINDAVASLPVLVYPNPSNGSFMVNLPASATQVEVLDITGRILQTQTLLNTTTLPVSITGAGLYFVRVSNRKSSVVQKVVVM